MLMRLPFLTVTLGAVLTGTAWAVRETGHLDVVRFLAALFGGFCLQAACNAANDYFDLRKGTDAANVSGTRPFSGGSGVLVEGLLTPGQGLAVSLVLAAAGGALGLVLHLTSPGNGILPIGGAGLFLVYNYNGWPVRLVNYGLGEVGIFLAWGPLMVSGAYYAQAGHLGPRALWPGMWTSGVLTVLVLLVNEFADRDADARAGRRTVVTMLGWEKGMNVYLALAASVCAADVVGVLFAGWPPAALAAVATFVLPWSAWRRGRASFGRWPEFLAAVKLTILWNLAFSSIISFLFMV